MKLGVAPPVLSAWENDRGGMPETPTLLRLAKALGCSVEELLAGVDAEYDLVATARAADVNSRLAELRDFLAEIRPDGQGEFKVEDLERRHVDRLLELTMAIATHVPVATKLWTSDGPRHGTEVPTARDESAHGEKVQTDSSSGTSYAKPAVFVSHGGSPHGHEEPGTSDRHAQDAPSSDDEVRRRILSTYDQLLSTIERLRFDADGLRTVVDVLRTDPAAADPRAAESGHAGRRPPVRARGTKSRRRA